MSLLLNTKKRKSTSTNPDPHWNNVVLFLKGDGTNDSTNIVDSSPTPKTVSVFGNARISTAQSKYGGSSIYFDGAGDYLNLAGNTDFVFGTSDFTIEAWAYFTIVSGAIIDFRPISTQGAFPLIYANGINALAYHISSGIRIIGSFTLNQWFHVAVSRNNNVSKMYVNGTQIGSDYIDNNNISSSSNVRIGLAAFNNYPVNGYIDSLRVTKGVGRYPSNFNAETDTYLNV